MKHFRRVAVMAASLSLAFAMPALAQDSWPMESGDYVEVSSIEIDDGHGLEYAQFLASSWKRNQEFAKAQGWITGYEVLTNEFARKAKYNEVAKSFSVALQADGFAPAVFEIAKDKGKPEAAD